MTIDENKLHNLARVYMDKFCYTPASLDEWLCEHGNKLTPNERNLGYAILETFN